ncbi:hypothetical protein [Crossiella sp. NPDC003009]
MGEGADFTVSDRTAMAMLTATGQAFEATWSRHRNAISAGEAGIGSGRLAQAFLGNYRPAEAPLKRSADAVPGICQRCADIGDLSAEDYTGADQRAARRFDIR